MAKLTIIERQVNNVTILDMNGDIIFSEGNVVLRHSIRNLLIEGKKKILLNFLDVCFIDSSGIGELISGLTAVTRENGELKLLNLPQRIKEILAISKLLTVFHSFENEKQALDSFNK